MTRVVRTTIVIALAAGAPVVLTNAARASALTLASVGRTDTTVVAHDSKTSDWSAASTPMTAPAYETAIHRAAATRPANTSYLPEPGILMLFGLGLLGLGRRLRRKA